MNTNVANLQATHVIETTRVITAYLMAAISLFVGGFQLLAHGPIWMLWISTITLTGVGFFGIIYMLTSRSFLTPWNIFATSLALGYGFGSLNTMLSEYVIDGDFSMVTSANAGTIGLAMGATLVLTAILLLLGSVDNYELIPRQHFSDNDQRDTLIVLLVVTLGTVVAVSTGLLGYQGNQSGGNTSQQVSPLASLVVSSMTATLSTTVLAFAGRPQARRVNWLLISCCFILLGVQATQGRRVFMFSILICAIAYFASHGIRRLLTTKGVATIIGVVVLVSGVMRFFYAMRVATRSDMGATSLAELVQAGWHVFQNPELYNLANDLSENNSTRTFIIGYLAELIQASEESGAWVGGQLAIFDFAMSVPTVIWPGKWKIIEESYAEEGVCHPVFGLPLWDASNTALTAGFCDFRWLGLLLYPLLVVAMMTLANRLVWRSPIVVRSLVCFATMEGMMQVENQLSAYLTSVRNLAVLCLFGWLLVWIRRRNDGQPVQSGISA